MLDWVYKFISSRGNEYFCEIDEDYLTDRFNLTGLNTEVQYYQYALDLVTDVFDLDCDDDMREQIEKSARHLYGLVHARYITTTRGLAKMVSCGFRFKFIPRNHHNQLTCSSSKSTKRAISASVPVLCVPRTPSSQPACPTLPPCSRSNFTAANAKTFTTPSPAATPTSTVPTSAPRSRTSFSRSIQLSSRRRRSVATSLRCSDFVCMRLLL